MFRDSAQRLEVCRILLTMKGLERFYLKSDIGPSGFTENFAGELILIKSNESNLSSGEQVLVKVVADFWNGTGLATVPEVTGKLDSGVTRAIGELMTAVAQHRSEFVDRWIGLWNGYDPDSEYYAS